MKLSEQLRRFCPGFALYDLRHHGCRCPGDCAAGASKADITNAIAFHIQKDSEAVPAQRVVSFGFMIHRCRLAVVPGSLAVLQNQLLIKFTQLGHQTNTSRTFWMPSTKASISALVL